MLLPPDALRPPPCNSPARAGGGAVHARPSNVPVRLKCQFRRRLWRSGARLDDHCHFVRGGLTPQTLVAATLRSRCHRERRMAVSGGHGRRVVLHQDVGQAGGAADDEPVPLRHAGRQAPTTPGSRWCRLAAVSGPGRLARHAPTVTCASGEGPLVPAALWARTRTKYVPGGTPAKVAPGVALFSTIVPML